MGKQMTYYMEREVFTQLAQIAVDLGCVILKQNGSKIISGDTSIIDSHCSKYYFSLPAAGEINEELPLGCYNSNAGCVIEASYSTRTKDLCLKRGKLYITSGFSTPNGDFIECPACLLKVYKKLVLHMKDLTLRVEVPADRMSTRLTYYADPTGRTHKLYMTKSMLARINRTPYTLC